MRPFGVVPANPLSKGSSGFGEVAKVVLPDVLLLETAKEAFDNSILFGSVRRDELRAEPVVSAGGAKAPALKDQAIVAAHQRQTSRTQRTEPCEAGLLECPLGFLGAAEQGETQSQ